MPLRQVQIHLPIEKLDDFTKFVQEEELEILWQGRDNPEWGIMAFLVVDALNSDPLVQCLMDRFGEEEHFRLVLSEVTALYPRPEKKEEAEKEEENQEESGEQNVPESEDNSSRENVRRIAIEELEERLYGEADLSTTYILTVIISALVAALGLMRGNTAVVIGAMVIAPLLGPNMALALGTTLGKFDLIKKSLITNCVGLTIALFFAVLMGLFLTIDPEGGEFQSRTIVEYSDIVLALATGVAGALAVTTGVSAALVGVMVAVALMPPLVTAGLMLGSGHFQPAMMAALLTGINLIAVNVSAVLTFLFKGIKPRNLDNANPATILTTGAVILWLFLLATLTGLVWFAKSYQ